MAEIRPQPGRQEQFLSSPADIVIYGGAAGGGKTWGLLLDGLRDIANKDFVAVIFRRTYPEVTNPGGLWDESATLYPYAGGIGVKGSLAWTFPKGARIQFGHCQDEESLKDWDGAQICLLDFDQLEHFTEKMFWYLGARNRSMCGIPPRIRATCNPDPDSWLVSGPDGWGSGFISWWISDDGYANLDRAGVIRWFIRLNDKIIWADERETLLQFGSEDNPVYPRSVTFIPATVWDNQKLLEVNPEYLANLDALPLLERERFKGDKKRGGNWKIRAGAGKIFNRAWFAIVPEAPKGGIECRGWDYAATIRGLKNDNPDFTAGVKIRKTGGKYYILDAINERYAAGEIDSLVKTTSNQDRITAGSQGARFMVRWETEPGSAGIRETVRMKQMLSGFDAEGRTATGDKISRWKALATDAEHGNVLLVAGPWNDAFLAHLHGQPDLDHDDMADGAGVAYNEIKDVPEARPQPQPSPMAGIMRKR